jgi:hypothetical protein
MEMSQPSDRIIVRGWTIGTDLKGTIVMIRRAISKGNQKEEMAPAMIFEAVSPS